MLPRHHWARRSEQLDPVRDSHEISLHVSAYDFPWDNLQALSFALFRTYAVPSIGRLLDETEEFTGRVQKRYDDTGLLLEEVQRHGFGDPRGRSAVRRINQMHAMYDISNEDFRYVLSTFVVVPKRWMDDYGFRRLTPNEIAATTNYYIELGRHMNIKDLPAGLRRVRAAARRLRARALRLRPRRSPRGGLDAGPDDHVPAEQLRPEAGRKRFAYSLMDEPLLRAFRYPVPTRVERGFFRGAMRLRARLLRLFPARSKPKWVSTYGYFRTYPAGYEIDELGTFPHRTATAASATTPEPTEHGEAVS